MSVGPDPEDHSGEELLRLGAGIVAAYVSRNAVSPDAVPDIIRTVHQALEGLSRSVAPPAVEERTNTDPSSSTSRSSALPASRSSPRGSAWPTTRPLYAAARRCAGVCPGRR